MAYVVWRNFWKGLSIRLEYEHSGSDLIFKVKAIPAETGDKAMDTKTKLFARNYMKMFSKMIAVPTQACAPDFESNAVNIVVPNGKKYEDDNVEQMQDCVAQAHGVTGESCHWQQQLLCIPGNDGCSLLSVQG